MDKSENVKFSQSELNIGTLGHVDHGKTTLTKAITGVFTDKHSESIKRSMTIKLGYADAIIRKCENCEGPEAYTTSLKCENCEGEARPVRRISLLDAPGHEMLMATAIAGSNIIDAVLFVIAATEPCPMPQTKEHLMVMSILKIKKIIIVQTKIDIVGKEKALAHYKQIKNFVKGTIAEEAPVIPVVASKGINVDVLLEAISKIEPPERDINGEPLMYIARSFDVNKPGTPIENLIGGVIGGSIAKGKFRKGEEIEIRPGFDISSDKKREEYKTIITRIESMSTSTGEIEEAIAGGLIAISTDMDPAFTKADSLAGCVAGHVGKLPDMVKEFTMEYHPIERSDIPKQALKEGEPIILGVGTATTVGYINLVRKNKVKVTLKHQVCTDKSAKISVLRNFSQRWRLTGYGVIS
ncbi:MAG: translation initiation factor IF-2 subunit gamma [Candidatus Micrarchaeia archaeon]